MLENPFKKLSDADLVRAYNDYEDWENTCVIREDSLLVAPRDQYKEAYGVATCLLLLERGILSDCAARYVSDHS